MKNEKKVFELSDDALDEVAGGIALSQQNILSQQNTLSQQNALSQQDALSQKDALGATALF